MHNPMQNQPDSQRDVALEAKVSRELLQLPHLKAPATLLPRVMAAIQARQAQPWYRRPWHAWPRKIQCLIGPLMTLFPLLAFYLSRIAWNELANSGVAQQVDQKLSLLSLAGNTLDTLLNACLVAGRALMGQPLLLAGIIVSAVMYLACIGIGTACFRVVFNQRAHL
jgi:hypothetical protein